MKKTFCTKVSAAVQTHLIFSKWVMVSIHECVQVGANRPDIPRCWSEDQWHLQCVRSVPYSLSSNNAMLLLLLTETINLPEWQTPAIISSDLWQPNSTALHWLECKIWGENAVAGLPSLWRRWTEAALDRCLMSDMALSKASSMTQLMSGANVSVLYSCKRRKFWAFNLTAHNTHVTLNIIFVNFVNVKQEVLCCLQQNFANFGLLCFA